MKITLSWLERYCSSGLSAGDLAEKLTMSGTEVEDVQEIGDDTVLTLEVTSNRPDLLGVLGIAREVSALTGAPLRPPETDLPAGKEDVTSLTSVKNEAEDLCPLYTAKVISGLTVSESPGWLKDLLAKVGLRPVNNIVDVTNFIMLETGQPLHAFDLDKLQKKRIVVRRARAGETMMSIDGTECKLCESDLVIADEDSPVAIAGIMGGLNTEVDGSTKNILLESALFDPFAVRQTSRRLSLASDSSYRFERGVTTESVALGSDRACRLILELAGGSAAKGTIEAGSRSTKPLSVSLRWDRLNKLLGIPVPKKEALVILKRLGFAAKKKIKDKVTVAVPQFRRDIEREVDLIEEIARVWGYDRIPVLSTMRIASPERSRFGTVASRCRGILAALGFYEVITPSFVAEEDSLDLWAEPEPLALENPVRESEPLLRKTLITSVLQAVKTNEDKRNAKCRLFELARVYLPAGEKLPAEKTMLTAVSPEGFYSLKGTLQHILDTFGIEARLEKTDLQPFEPGRAAVVLLPDDTRLGFIGDISSARMSAFEVDLDTLTQKAVLLRQCPDIPRFPPVTRDYAFILDEEIEWAAVEKSVRSNGSSLVEDVRPFDTYRGGEIGAGKKSVAFSVVYRLPDRTLTKQEVDGVQAKIVAALESNLNGLLRA